MSDSSLKPVTLHAPLVCLAGHWPLLETMSPGVLHLCMFFSSFFLQRFSCWENRTWQNMSTQNEAFSYVVSTCQSRSLIISASLWENPAQCENPVASEILLVHQFMVVHATKNQGFCTSHHRHILTITWDLVGLVSSLCLPFGCSLHDPNCNPWANG